MSIENRSKRKTDLNKSGNYVCIPFNCNVYCIWFVCILMYLYLNNIYRRAAVIFSTGWYGACEKNSGNLHPVWKKILHVTWFTGSDVTNHATLFNYWTFVEVGMQCCWKVNFMLTPALRRSIWLILLFNNTSCLPKHYLTIVLLYDRYISVGRCVEIWAPVGIFG